jgi:hypothetical protein
MGRERLAEATTRYFEQLSSDMLAEENALAKDMMSAAQDVNFDEEI